VNQPFEPKGSKEIGKEISDRSQSSPKGIDGPEECIKVLERNLGKKNKNDSNGDEDGEDKSF